MAESSDSSIVLLTLRNGKSITISGEKALKGTNYYKFKYEQKSAYASQGLFISMKTEARNSLHAQGVTIISDAVWREVICGVEDVGGFVSTPLVETRGWTGPYFTEKSGKVHSPKGFPRARATFPRDKKRPTKGALKYWIANVAVPLTGQQIPMLATMAAAAAPLLEIVDEPQNFGFEFWGPAATGKTTCLRIMASFADDPGEIPNFNATHAGLEGLFPSHADLPFPVDEANLNSHGATFLRDFAFRLAQGTMRVTAHQPYHQRYRFIFGTTSNDPFYAGLKDSPVNAADAALQRLIPLRISADNPWGVFDFLPEGYTTSGALAENIEKAIAVSHGGAMRKLIKALVNARAKDGAKLQTEIRNRVRAFERVVGVADTDRGRTRVSSAFGLLYAGGEFAKTCGILPANWDCMAACVAGYRNYQAQLPHHTPVAARLVTIAQRRETLDLRDSPMPDLSDDDVKRHGAFIRQGVGGRIELLLTDAIQREYFPDWKSLRATLERDSTFICEPGRRQAHRQVRRGKKRERFYCFVLSSDAVNRLDSATGDFANG